MFSLGASASGEVLISVGQPRQGQPRTRWSGGGFAVSLSFPFVLATGRLAAVNPIS